MFRCLINTLSCSYIEVAFVSCFEVHPEEKCVDMFYLYSCVCIYLCWCVYSCHAINILTETLVYNWSGRPQPMLLPLGFFQFMFFSFQELRANFDSRTLDLTILSSPVFQCLGALTVNYGKSDMLYRYKCVTMDCPWRFCISFRLWCLLSKWRQTQVLRCQFMLSGRVLAQDVDLPSFVCFFLFHMFWRTILLAPHSNRNSTLWVLWNSFLK